MAELIVKHRLARFQNMKSSPQPVWEAQPTSLAATSTLNQHPHSHSHPCSSIIREPVWYSVDFIFSHYFLLYFFHYHLSTLHPLPPPPTGTVWTLKSKAAPSFLSVIHQAKYHTLQSHSFLFYKRSALTLTYSVTGIKYDKIIYVKCKAQPLACSQSSIISKCY